MSDRIHAAIVGGGIGGLAAANALLHRGLSVAVYEQASALGEVGAGVFIYPNSLRQLERMGLGAALARVGAKVGAGSEYYRMDGSVVGKILTADSSGWNGMYGMHRADLLQALAGAVPSAAIHTGHRCTGFTQDGQGAHLSFAGTVTFKNAEPLRQALRATPQDRVLVETDAPFLTPVPHRGRTNASYLVPLTMRVMA